MSQALVWSVLYDQAVDAFGERPSGEVEERILEVFRHRPEMVAQSLARTTRKFQEGAIYSPWIIWAKNVEEASAGSAHAGVTAGGEQTRAKQTERAKRWIRNTGIHFDRSHEVYEEVFTTNSSPLRGYRDEQALVTEMLAYWAECRPGGERVERELEERTARYGLYWQKVRGKKRRN